MVWVSLFNNFITISLLGPEVFTKKEGHNHSIVFSPKMNAKVHENSLFSINFKFACTCVTFFNKSFLYGSAQHCLSFWVGRGSIICSTKIFDIFTDLSFFFSYFMFAFPTWFCSKILILLLILFASTLQKSILLAVDDFKWREQSNRILF